MTHAKCGIRARFNGKSFTGIDEIEIEHRRELGNVCRIWIRHEGLEFIDVRLSDLIGAAKSMDRASRAIFPACGDLQPLPVEPR